MKPASLRGSRAALGLNQHRSYKWPSIASMPYFGIAVLHDHCPKESERLWAQLSGNLASPSPSTNQTGSSGCALGVNYAVYSYTVQRAERACDRRSGRATRHHHNHQAGRAGERQFKSTKISRGERVNTRLVKLISDKGVSDERLRGSE